MRELIKQLTGNFVILDLGSAGDSDPVAKFSEAITLIELDALSPSDTVCSKYYKRISLKKAVGEKSEKRLFYKRKWRPCSSFLKADMEIVSMYGLEDEVESDGRIELECESIKNLLDALQIRRVDFIKTDLEGLDYEILSSAPEIISQALVITSELRFQPFYLGEPSFHTTAGYLADLGFEIITMKPEVWKLPTPNRQKQRDGRLVFADTTFFLKPSKIKHIFKEEAPLAFVKQIILAKAYGLHNYAEFIYERVKEDLPENIREELEEYLKPSSRLEKVLNNMANAIAWFPKGDRILFRFYLIALALAKASSLSKRHKQWMRFL
jgi:FkbM family methyltransferase